MEALKKYTIKESVARRLQFLITLPRILDVKAIKIIKDEILITPDCFNAALLSFSKHDSSSVELKKFLEMLNTFLWKNHFPETASEYRALFLSNEWNEIRNKAERLVPIFKR